MASSVLVDLQRIFLRLACFADWEAPMLWERNRFVDGCMREVICDTALTGIGELIEAEDTPLLEEFPPSICNFVCVLYTCSAVFSFVALCFVFLLRVPLELLPWDADLQEKKSVICLILASKVFWDEFWAFGMPRYAKKGWFNALLEQWRDHYLIVSRVWSVEKAIIMLTATGYSINFLMQNIQRRAILRTACHHPNQSKLNHNPKESNIVSHVPVKI